MEIESSTCSILCLNFYSKYRRDTHDVTHKIVAVGSRTVESAQAFIDRLIPEDGEVKAYGSYHDVFADQVSLYRQSSFQFDVLMESSQTVQVVYIGATLTLLSREVSTDRLPQEPLIRFTTITH